MHNVCAQNIIIQRQLVLGIGFVFMIIKEKMVIHLLLSWEEQYTSYKLYGVGLDDLQGLPAL